MQQKPRTRVKQDQWSIQGAKDLKEQERVRLTLQPQEQGVKKGPGRPKGVKNREKKDELIDQNNQGRER